MATVQYLADELEAVKLEKMLLKVVLITLTVQVVAKFIDPTRYASDFL